MAVIDSLDLGVFSRFIMAGKCGFPLRPILYLKNWLLLSGIVIILSPCVSDQTVTFEHGTYKCIRMGQ